MELASAEKSTSVIEAFLPSYEIRLIGQADFGGARGGNC